MIDFKGEKLQYQQTANSSGSTAKACMRSCVSSIDEVYQHNRIFFPPAVVLANHHTTVMYSPRLRALNILAAEVMKVNDLSRGDLPGGTCAGSDHVVMLLSAVSRFDVCLNLSPPF